MNIPFLSPFVEAVGKYFTNKQTINAAKQERKDKLEEIKLTNRLEGIASAQAADLDADSMARKFAGYMDDISFYIFLLPLPLAFHPDVVPHLEAGFKALDSMPEWWKYGLGMMLITVWGWKRVFSPIIEKIAMARFGLK